MRTKVLKFRTKTDGIGWLNGWDKGMKLFRDYDKPELEFEEIKPSDEFVEAWDGFWYELESFVAQRTRSRPSYCLSSKEDLAEAFVKAVHYCPQLKVKGSGSTNSSV